MIIIQLKTWRCVTCNFVIDGAVPPTKEGYEQLALGDDPKVPSNSPFYGLEDNICPNCKTPTMARVDDDPAWADHAARFDLDPTKLKGQKFHYEAADIAEALDFHKKRKLLKGETEDQRQEQIKHWRDEVKPSKPQDIALDRQHLEDK